MPAFRVSVSNTGAGIFATKSLLFPGTQFQESEENL
jgi:hypothetical protein